MDIIEAILLGILQGITEFLPVSSSGHLALARALIARELVTGITFEIVVHFGSFCSIAVYYRKLLGEIISDVLKSLTPSGLKEKRFVTNPNSRLTLIILLSMIPAMLVGFTLKDPIEEAFVNPFFVSIMLLVTGGILFSTKFIKHPDKDVNANRGFWMGVAQAFAILPGISRSGSTISLGLLMGVDRDKVANFSFLMVLPVLAGAMLLEIVDLISIGQVQIPVTSLVAGFFTSFISGYIALTYLIRLLKRRKFHYFAYYCWTLGIIGMFLFY
ncbi:MAG: undecaprenyl-diphosphate phosphatase [Bacteroidota bacterium]